VKRLSLSARSHGSRSESRVPCSCISGCCSSPPCL
jgi:hypothetical protein